MDRLVVFTLVWGPGYADTDREAVSFHNLLVLTPINTPSRNLNLIVFQGALNVWVFLLRPQFARMVENLVKGTSNKAHAFEKNNDKIMDITLVTSIHDKYYFSKFSSLNYFSEHRSRPAHGSAGPTERGGPAFFSRGNWLTLSKRARAEAAGCLSVRRLTALAGPAFPSVRLSDNDPRKICYPKKKGQIIFL